MTRTHALLHRKLEELESLLKNDDGFLPPSDAASGGSVCDEVNQKFIFIRSLLAAEINSDEAYHPHHLRHIADRLHQMERDYRSLSNPGMNPGTDLIDDDSTSACSCTESCLGEVGDGASLTYEDAEMFAEGLDGERGPSVEDGPENIFHSFNGGNAIVGYDVALVNPKGYADQEKNQTRETKTVWLCSGIALGMGLGMGLMGFLMSEFSGIVQQASLPVPT